MSKGEKCDNHIVPLWKGLLPLLFVCILSTQAEVVDTFGNICKPIALQLIEFAGLPTSDHGAFFTAGTLEVPWTRDCAGMNILLVLLAIFCWINRGTKQDIHYWKKMSFIVVASVAANVLRIITLVAYRYLVFPKVESPQLHYFFGLLWLIPFALLALPRRAEKEQKMTFLELLHISVVIALLAPFLNLPKHWITAVGVLFCLINTNYSNNVNKRMLKVFALWYSLAFFISWSGIESLWLPWLLLCPLSINNKWASSLAGVTCLIASCPLFILLPMAEVLGTLIFAYTIHRMLNSQKKKLIESKSESFTFLRLPIKYCVIFLLFLPFITAIAFNSETDTLKPPANAKTRVIEGMGYEVRLNGQSPDVGLLWYNSQGNDRHHTIKVCLKYRGINLVESEFADVKTDGERWYREYFIVGDSVISSHRQYVWETLGFQRQSGTHLIFVGYCKSQTPEDFAGLCEQMVNDLFSTISRK